MGTQVYRESYFPGYHYATGHNELSANGKWQQFFGDKTTQNMQYCNGVAPNNNITNLFSGSDKDALKEMMLKHEVTFKYQLCELHRLYKVQKEMMTEMKRKELYKHQMPIESSPSSSPLVYQMPRDDAPRWHKPSFLTIDSKNIEMLESRPSKARKRLFDLHLPADNYIDVDEEDKSLDDKKPAILSYQSRGNDNIGVPLGFGSCLRSSVRLVDLNEPILVEDLDTKKSVDFVGYDSQSLSKESYHHNGREHLLYMDAQVHYRTQLISQSSELPNKISQTKWYLHSNANRLSNGIGVLNEPSIKSKYDGPLHFNSDEFDHLSSKKDNKDASECSVNFGIGYLKGSNAYVMKSIKDLNINAAFLNPVSSEILTADSPCKKEEIDTYRDKYILQTTSPRLAPKKVLGDPILGYPCTPKTDNKIGLIDINLVCDFNPNAQVDVEETEKGNEKRSVNFRGQFDLNLCACEDETTLDTSSRSTTVDVNIALEIDLQAPPLAEIEEETSSQKAEKPCSEADTVAAMAIVAISSFANIDSIQSNTLDSCESSPEDTLLWFSEIASSCSETFESELDNELRCEYVEEKKIYSLDEIDDFEAMTLRLTELKEEDYMPTSLITENMEVEFEIDTNTLPRTRKGQVRRVRQMKDFQKNILPGLVSLSRHEVAEDIHTFSGLMKATGHHWPVLARRNGGGARGRRRFLVDEAAPLVDQSVFSRPLEKRINNIEIIGLEERILTGWGKTPRKPRQRRCHVSNLSSIALP